VKGVAVALFRKGIVCGTLPNSSSPSPEPGAIPMFHARTPWLVIVLLAFLVAACGSSGLTGASTCDEFMHATAEEQQRATVSLAGEYGKPDYATPLGIPAVPYYCASHPDETLDDFFANAE